MSKDERTYRKTPYKGVQEVISPQGKRLGYRVRYRDTSGRQRAQTFRRLTDAKVSLDALRTDVRRKEWSDPALGREKLETFVEGWLKGRTDLERTTRDRDATLLRVHILPKFGNSSLISITDLAVREFKAELLASGLRHSTVTKILGTLGNILGVAVANRLIPENPCARVEKPGEVEAETVFLTLEQLLDLAQATQARFAPMILLAGTRGLRFGECAGLRPGRVDLLRGRLDVTEALKEVRGDLYFGPPKWKRRRTIPLPAFLSRSLETYLNDYPPRRESITDGLVMFTNTDGSLLRRSNFARRVFAPAVRRAGLDEGLTFHGLRHSAVSILVAEGATIVELAAIMGWARSTAAAMVARYGHLFEHREDHLTERMDVAFQRAEESRRSRTEGTVTPLG